MQLDALLEVAIGLVVTWLILSIATSQLQEYIVELLSWRSRFLENNLRDMFQSRELVDQFYSHPFIRSLYTKNMLGKEQKPTNIPNEIFAKAAVDVFLNAGKRGAEVPAESMTISGMQQHLKESMGYLESNSQPLARTIQHLVPKMDAVMTTVEEEATKLENNLAKFRSNSEAWFDTTMTEASRSYRKNAHAIALVIGIGIALVLNIDSINITNRLWRDPTLRQAIVAQAGNIDPKDETSFDTTAAKLNELSLPIGWARNAMPRNQADWAFKAFGFFITGAAAAQGAPFWFDILAKVSGLKKSRDEQKSKSE
jgi:hypothetical protein